MVMETPDETRRRVSGYAREICADYGLHGGLVFDEASPIPDSNRNRLYLIAGYDESMDSDGVPPGFDPEQVMRRNERSDRLFYPDALVIDLFREKDQMKVNERLIDYCRHAEFIKSLYAEYGMSPPKCLRVSEVHQLLYYHDVANNLALPDAVRERCRQGLQKFFRREKATGFRRRWLDYFRSDKFPDDKGALGRIMGYLRRSDRRLTLTQLADTNTNIMKLEMQEHEYKCFAKVMDNLYPDVYYALGEKETVNHGMVRGRHDQISPIGGRMVTGEEYAVIRRERFAREGWEALADLQPSYWEYRPVYFRAPDAPLIASAYQRTVLEYAKPNSIQELGDRGKICMQDIPMSDFMNFVTLAKQNNVMFGIDLYGAYAVPNLDFVHVMYYQGQEDEIISIVTRMMQDKIEDSHLVPPPAEERRPRLNEMIDRIERTPARQVSDDFMPELDQTGRYDYGEER